MANYITASPKVNRSTQGALLTNDMCKVLAYRTGLPTGAIKIYLDELHAAMLLEIKAGREINYCGIFEITNNQGTGQELLPLEEIEIREDPTIYFNNQPDLTKKYFHEKYAAFLKEEIAKQKRVIIKSIATVKYRYSTGNVGIAISPALTTFANKQDIKLRLYLKQDFKDQINPDKED